MMRRFAISTQAVLIWTLAASNPCAGPARADDGSPGVPEAFRPFAHLIGSWKGVGIPEANKVKGWPETHAWAWAFDEGEPVALDVTIEGDQMLESARLGYEPELEAYRLEGHDPKGEPFTYTGKLDEDKQVLTLEREQELTGGVKQRLTLRLNSNGIRYELWDDRQEPGAPRYGRVVVIKMGKEGESFAAGGGASNLPKCVLTGGAATLSVTFEGKSYPVCCTGCRDEFEANPERWVKKAAERAAAEAKAGGDKDKPGVNRVGDDDGSFGSLLGDSKAESGSKPDRKAMPKDEAKNGDEAPKDETPKADSKPREKAKDKAAELLERAQDLEKSGKTQAAVVYYKMVVKDHPKSPQAKAAGERLKKLEDR
jgi:hypothetical protein